MDPAFSLTGLLLLPPTTSEDIGCRGGLVLLQGSPDPGVLRKDSVAYNIPDCLTNNVLAYTSANESATWCDAQAHVFADGESNSRAIAVSDIATHVASNVTARRCYAHSNIDADADADIDADVCSDVRTHGDTDNTYACTLFLADDTGPNVNAHVVPDAITTRPHVVANGGSDGGSHVVEPHHGSAHIQP